MDVSKAFDRSQYPEEESFRNKTGIRLNYTVTYSINVVDFLFVLDMGTEHLENGIQKFYSC